MPKHHRCNWPGPCQGCDDEVDAAESAREDWRTDPEPPVGLDWNYPGGEA